MRQMANANVFFGDTRRRHIHEIQINAAWRPLFPPLQVHSYASSIRGIKSDTMTVVQRADSP